MKRLVAMLLHKNECMNGWMIENIVIIVINTMSTHNDTSCAC